MKRAKDAITIKNFLMKPGELIVHTKSVWFSLTKLPDTTGMVYK